MNDQKSKKSFLFFKLSPNGATFENFSTSRILLILFSIFVCGVIYQGLTVYSDTRSWSYELTHWSERGDKLTLKAQHKKVKELISAWTKISSLNDLDEKSKMIRTDIDSTLRAYENFNYMNWDSPLKVSYLYHRAYLRIIYTDLHRVPEEIFLAKKEVEEALNLVEHALNESDTKFFDDIGMVGRLKRLALNIDVFTYLGTGLEQYKSKAGKSLKELGGCPWFVQQKYFHVDIYRVLGCKPNNSLSEIRN